MTTSVIGHRGAAGHTPENTLASLRKASDLGVRWVEFDATLSSDDEIVLFHDALLKRTTGRSGRVSETPWADLQKLDAGSWFSEDFAGEPIPNLHQTFKVLGELGLGAVIEIKPATGSGEKTGRLVAEFTARHWPDALPAPILSSFDEDALAAARTAAPGISRALNVSGVPPDWAERLKALDCVALHCGHRNLTEKTAHEIVGSGAILRCFTINDAARAETLFDWGVGALFTDYPERLMIR
ncbi:MAG: glycerophosphodiester phosphodiesterase [Alphaproteobacteria bacterium]